MEINCGTWELKRWDDIPKGETASWMENLIHVRIPGGESYADLYERVSRMFDYIQLQPKPSVIVTHGGVVRSILSYITNTPLKDSFNVFSFYYGCVIKITAKENGLHYEVLSNIPHEKETHKPAHL
jgi:alpha-ribazole phosphatase